ncbi:DUF721 domain-containing protein [Fuscibacter oryzae]|uniref:DUF721 domain-containing protein n=1 Tax=Fuscibacter oryzae TaxID=2803939 RepID=A0A8J7SSW3_9RHOB|nr:DUF721 domain-containing protein [Fuscibacter oryzae]MBL4927047.1 DUF721 domain-containing protein [Fuscibacter oryzae]
MAKSPPPHSPFRRERGFEPASRLLAERIRTAGESRGFAVARLLTQWPEIAGEELARITRPVKISYGREGFGATLTLLTTGAVAPMVEMRKDHLRERVNAVYGYSAIARIHLTQTASTGFAEGQAQFAHAPKAPAAPDPVLVAKATETAAEIKDDGLRAALELLARNVLTRRNPKEGA